MGPTPSAEDPQRACYSELGIDGLSSLPSAPPQSAWPLRHLVDARCSDALKVSSMGQSCASSLRRMMPMRPLWRTSQGKHPTNEDRGRSRWRRDGGIVRLRRLLLLVSQQRPQLTAQGVKWDRLVFLNADTPVVHVREHCGRRRRAMFIRLHTRWAPPRLRAFWSVFIDANDIPDIVGSRRVRKHTDTLFCLIQRSAAFFNGLAACEDKIRRRVAALAVGMDEVQRHPQPICLYLFDRQRCRFFPPVDKLADRYIARPELILLLHELAWRRSGFDTFSRLDAFRTWRACCSCGDRG